MLEDYSCKLLRSWTCKFKCIVMDRVYIYRTLLSLSNSNRISFDILLLGLALCMYKITMNVTVKLIYNRSSAQLVSYIVTYWIKHWNTLDSMSDMEAFDSGEMYCMQTAIHFVCR